MAENEKQAPQNEEWDRAKSETIEQLDHTLQGAQQIAEFEQEKKLFEGYNSTTSIVMSLLPLLDIGMPEVADKVRECLEAIQVAIHGKEVADELKLVWDSKES